MSNLPQAATATGRILSPVSAMLRPVVAPLEIFPAGSFVLHNNIFPDSRRKHEAAKRGGGWQISS